MFKKSLISLVALLLLSSCSYADDIYILKYSHDTNCTLSKNGKDIPLFDTRFKKKPPRSSYTCSAIQKEQYNDCEVMKKKNITAQFFGYGAYQYTNLIIAIQNPSPSVTSMIKIKCTKNLPKK